MTQSTGDLIGLSVILLKRTGLDPARHYHRMLLNPGCRPRWISGSSGRPRARLGLLQGRSPKFRPCPVWRAHQTRFMSFYQSFQVHCVRRTGLSSTDVVPAMIMSMATGEKCLPSVGRRLSQYVVLEPRCNSGRCLSVSPSLHDSLQ
jgi:hypothetical protein